MWRLERGCVRTGAETVPPKECLTPWVISVLTAVEWPAMAASMSAVVLLSAPPRAWVSVVEGERVSVSEGVRVGLAAVIVLRVGLAAALLPAAVVIAVVVVVGCEAEAVVAVVGCEAEAVVAVVGCEAEVVVVVVGCEDESGCLRAVLRLTNWSMLALAWSNNEMQSATITQQTRSAMMETST